MAFEAFCIVEIMGHQVIAGKVSEETHFGAPLMRVDVPKTTRRESFTVYYGGGAIYKITPTTEQIALAFVEKQDPEPVKPYMLALPSMVDKVDYSSPDSFPEDYGDDGADDDFDDERNIYDEDDDFDEDDMPPEYFADGEPVDGGPTNVVGMPSQSSLKLSDTERAIRRAKELMTRKFVILDTETTGFDSDDEIIQIAIIDETGATVLNSYIKPTKPITNTQYHGITDDMVKDAPSFADLYPQLEKALSGNLWLIYNAEYDERMLNQVCRKHDLAVFGSSRTECVMLLYADYYADWDAYHGNNRWQKLEVAMRRFKLERDGKEHDALSDCKATLAVLKAMAATESEEKEAAKDSSL